MAILIGTSGWHYPSWWGPFFPEGVRKKDALSYYATRFATTELNAPFYRTPTLEAVTAWAEQTPEDFVFSGRPPVSLPTGNGSRKSPAAASS